MRLKSLFLLAGLAACQPGDPFAKARAEAAQQHARAAEQAIGTGDFARAVAAAELARQSQPENPAHTDLLVRVRAFETVASWSTVPKDRWPALLYEASAGRTRDKAHEHVYRAVLAAGEMAQGDLAAALEDMKSVVNDQPEWALGHATLGRFHDAKKETDAAILEYERALRLDAKSKVHLPLARLYASRNLIDKARAMFNEALAESRTATVFYELGQLEDQAGRTQEALGLYERAVALYPRHGPARLAYAEHLVFAQRHGDAEHHFKVAGQLGMEPLATRGLGVIHTAREDWAQAAQAFALVLQLTPQDVGTLMLAAQANDKLGKKDEAAKLYERFVAIAVNQPNEAQRVGSAKARLAELKKK
jgi:tetratricopeptide (TPR) repeat protein